MAEPDAIESASSDDRHDAELFSALADELAGGVQGLYLLARSIAEGLDAGLPRAAASLTAGFADPDSLYEEAERRATRIAPALRAVVVQRALEQARIETAELLGTLAEALAVVRAEANVTAPSAASTPRSLVQVLDSVVQALGGHTPPAVSAPAG
jgi:hypothetical protein